MKTLRIARLALTALTIGGLAACQNARELTDAQVTQLLRIGGTSANDSSAPIEAASVECLRVWSGDAELANSSSTAPANASMKTTCRQKIDGWIADPGRNPDKITFEELSKPAAVRQATALLNLHRPAKARPMVGDAPPPELAHPGAQGATAAVPAASNVNTGAAGDFAPATAALGQLDALCKEAKQNAGSSTTTPAGRYAANCNQRIDWMRTRITTMSSSHANAQQAETMTKNIQRLLANGREILGIKPAETPTGP